MLNERQRLTKRIVDAAKPGANRYTIWDAVVPGFGLRITSTGTKTFTLRYRARGRRAQKRYLSIGRYGVLTVEEARDHARKVLGAVASGEDPAREIANHRETSALSEVADDFMSAHVKLKRKDKTIASYEHVLNRHIKPVLGAFPMHELARAEVYRLHASLAATPYMANYVVTVLSSLYSWAGRRGLVTDDYNPARRIEKFREQPRERFLNAEEFSRLGAALREAETVGIPYDVDETKATAKHAPKPENRRIVVAPDATAAIRLLMLTGCRLREVLNLRWQEVDLQRGLLLLADSKTGRKTVVLSPQASLLLARLPRTGESVFPGADGTKPRSDIKRPWTLVTRRAGLVGLRIHDLRHSYASVAAGAPALACRLSGGCSVTRSPLRRLDTPTSQMNRCAERQTPSQHPSRAQWAMQMLPWSLKTGWLDT